MQSLVLTGAGVRRRYRQGHGCRRYRQGHGPRLQKFKGFMKKAASFGKQRILPHLQEIGTDTLLDIIEGKKLEIPRSNFNNTRTNLIKQQRRRRMHH